MLSTGDSIAIEPSLPRPASGSSVLQFVCIGRAHGKRCLFHGFLLGAMSCIDFSLSPPSDIGRLYLHPMRGHCSRPRARRTGLLAVESRSDRTNLLMKQVSMSNSKLLIDFLTSSPGTASFSHRLLKMDSSLLCIPSLPQDVYRIRVLWETLASLKHPFLPFTPGSFTYGSRFTPNAISINHTTVVFDPSSAPPAPSIQ
jgi:hypothetical protein